MHVASIAAFVAVARRGSVTAAAQDLQFSQPAVSRQIQALETTVGAALFERSGQQLEITATGIKLLPFAEAMLALSRAMTAHADVPTSSALSATSGPTRWSRELEARARPRQSASLPAPVSHLP